MNVTKVVLERCDEFMLCARLRPGHRARSTDEVAGTFGAVSEHHAHSHGRRTRTTDSSGTVDDDVSPRAKSFDDLGEHRQHRVEMMCSQIWNWKPQCISWRMRLQPINVRVISPLKLARLSEAHHEWVIQFSQYLVESCADVVLSTQPQLTRHCRQRDTMATSIDRPLRM
jgi:hypothetical protein